MVVFRCPLEPTWTWTGNYSERSGPESVLSAFADIVFQPSVNHSSKTYALSQLNTVLGKKPLQNPTGTFILAYSSIKSL